jgi:putative transposase
MTAHEFIGTGVPTSVILRHVGVSKSTFYYRPKEGRRGRTPSAGSWHQSGVFVSNDTILNAIRWLLNQEFVDYGYVKVTRWLQRLGLIINKKKVLRLMRSEGLLLARPKRRGSGKTWVKDLVPQADRPFRYMEVDIKYVRVDGIGRQALLLTVIDVHSRFNLGHLLQYTMQKDDVKELFRHIFATYDMPDGVTVRSDNGSQFESEVVRSYFAEQGTIHEFTKPATPEQNAHIEAYHSILQRAVCDQYLFTDLDHARVTLDRFRDFYNFERLHSGIGYRPPSEALAAMHVLIPDSTNINLTPHEHIKSIILGSQS